MQIYSSSMYCFGPFSDQLPERNAGKNPDDSSVGDFKPIIPISDSYTKKKKYRGISNYTLYIKLGTEDLV